jgi:hypothetical protein
MPLVLLPATRTPSLESTILGGKLWEGMVNVRAARDSFGLQLVE